MTDFTTVTEVAGEEVSGEQIERLAHRYYWAGEFCRGRDVLLVSGRKPNGFYGFPNAFVETEFRVCATARNWTTVTRIAKLLA